MFSKKDFANRLKTLRESHQITTVELAKEIGLSKQAISQFEKEMTYPHCNTICALADYFDVSLDYLVGRSEIAERR